MAIVWKDSYRIGNIGIDAEHEQAFALANKFIAAGDKASLRLCAMHLYQHIHRHFTHEETLMRQLAYPGYKAHVEWHNQFITRLNGLSEGIAHDSVNRDDVRALMEDWALQHIAQHDTELAQYLGRR